jgi:hypothetical protein
VIYVAPELGHDARLTLSIYGHVIDATCWMGRGGSARRIRAARDTRCVCGVSGREEPARGAIASGQQKGPK